MAEGLSVGVKIQAATTALDSYSTALVKVFDPFLLSNELCSRGVVDSSVLDSIVTSSSSTREEKASETLTVIADRVKTQPEVFDKFCEILRGDSATNEVVKSLKKNYDDSMVEGLYRTSSPEEFVQSCKREGLVESGARLVVRSKNDALWTAVLKSQSFIDQIAQCTIAETDDSEAISTAVKAFMMADLPNDLIPLLETIVLREGSVFKDNRNLQNLLILTAIKADPPRVMGYISGLDKYDGPDIATICISSELFEEAFTIYKQFDRTMEAMEVLVNHMKDLDRAQEFATQCNQPAVWEVLHKAQATD